MTRAPRPSCRLLLAILAMAVLGAHAQDATLTVSNESPTTADRISLDVSFTVAPGWTVEPWAARARTALDDAGWTVVEVTIQPPRLWSDASPGQGAAVEGALVHAGTIIVEPFLPGQYRIPPIEAVATSEIAKASGSIGAGDALTTDDQGDRGTLTGRIARDDLASIAKDRALAGFRTMIRPAGQPISLATPERTIDVTSLLPEDEEIPSLIPVPADPDVEKNESETDSAEVADAPLGEFRPVPEEPRNPGPLLALLGAGVALVAACVAVGVALQRARAARGTAPIDPVRELRRLAGSEAPDLAAVHRALRALAHHPGTDANPDNLREFESLTADIERFRYAPPGSLSTTGLGSPADLAKRASRLAQRIEITPVPTADKSGHAHDEAHERAGEGAVA